MSARAQHRLFPGFAGVALADILANGAAIIIMMIVITVMIKHEQEEKRLEQVEDVSVLLSRDLATSMVMNALPTSPPARLHDYKNSPLDRNPQHAVMPIVELHTDYIRNYYTGETISRDQLLRNDNAFDRYLKTLNPQQLARTRVDIYSIRLFYITMSIFKDYKTRPSHWHFIGYPEGDGDAPGGRPAGKPGSGEGEKLFAGDEPPADESSADETGEGQSQQGTSEPGMQASQSDNLGVPQDTELHSRPSEIENYPYDDLAFQSGDLQKQQAPEDLPGDLSEPAEEQARVSDEMFNVLTQMLAQSTGGKGKRQPQSRLSRFRSARAASESQDRLQQSPNQEDNQMTLESFRLLLPALFKFMREIQTEADAGGATRLAEYNFRRDVMQLIEKVPANTRPEMDALFDQLNFTLSQVPDATDASLTIHQHRDQPLRSNALAVAINQRVQNALLVGNARQPLRDDLPAEMEVSLHFGLYPTLFRGLRVPLKKDAIVLMPPEQPNPEEFRWRVVTMVNPASDDFMTAFVYAALDDQRRLLLASEENALNISELRVTTHYPTLPFRQEQWLLLLYGIPALLLALGVLRRMHKAA